MSIWKALIPIRSGSKSIPDKNIKLFCGKPLFYWATQAAVESGIFDGGVFVAADSEIYLEYIRKWTPAAVPVIRAPHTATDTASSESVMEWFLEQERCDILSLVQATTPTVTAGDFIFARKQFESEKSDSLVTGVPFQRFLWTGTGRPLNYDPLHRPRRQDMEPQFLENGSFYFTRTDLFNDLKCRLGGKISVFGMTVDTTIEIDEPGDWTKAEGAFKKRTTLYANSSMPKVLVVDVDGTLTDGGMYYGAEGEMFKKFNTRDGAALAQLRRKGFRILVCTGENSPSVDARMKKLGITDYYPGAIDKFGYISKWLSMNNYTWDDVCYVGDELNDLSSIRLSHYSICPADAHPTIRDVATATLNIRGGEGIMRDVLHWIDKLWPGEMEKEES